MTYTPPGWYPDPEKPGGRRWWNGSEWTEYTSDAKRVPRRDPEAATALRFTALPGKRTFTPLSDSGVRVFAPFAKIFQPSRSIITRVGAGRWPTEREHAAAGLGLFVGVLIRIVLAIAVVAIIAIITAIAGGYSS